MEPLRNYCSQPKQSLFAVRLNGPIIRAAGCSLRLFNLILS